MESEQWVPTDIVRGVAFYDQALSHDEQVALVDDLRLIAKQAPFFRPITQRGTPMSVRMTAAGQFGWYSDRSGYRYIETHPSGPAWPPIPMSVLRVWRSVVPATSPDPECCLINYYADGAKMGLHQDRDEADFAWPVVSISLGDDALFRLGNLTRGGTTESRWLRSGDVCVIGGDARLIYHGVDRIAQGSSTLLSNGGRINITLRVVR